MAYKWYFLRCQSGREKRIRDNAIHRLKIAGVDDVIAQVLMPFKIVQDMKRGKKRTVEEKLYPGYLMVQADLEGADETQINKARHRKSKTLSTQLTTTRFALYLAKAQYRLNQLNKWPAKPVRTMVEFFMSIR